MNFQTGVVRLAIIVLVTCSLLPIDQVAAQLCGNNVFETTEECDDGNAFGGDGCAANCTNETTLQLGLRPSASVPTASRSVIQSTLIAAPESLSGVIEARAGGSRAATVSNTRGESFDPGEVPLVFRKTGSSVISSIPGFPSCFRLFEAPELGPGNFGAGRIGCGSGLPNTNVVVEVDSATNLSMTNASGSGARGSAVMSIRFSNTFNVAPGNDNIACTDDDLNMAPPVTLTFTTGSAEAIIRNANGENGKVIASGSRAPCPGFQCNAPGEECLEGSCRRPCGGGTPCNSGGTGALIDCDLVNQGSGAIIGAGVLLDQPFFGDYSLYTLFAFGPAPATATPTVTPTGLSSSTPTVTATTIPPTDTPIPTPAPPSPTPTSTAVSTATIPPIPPSSTATKSPTATQPPASCVGDCDGTGSVTVDEIVRGVNIALGTLSIDNCPAFDTNADRAVTVDELVQAVNNALVGCPA